MARDIPATYPLPDPDLSFVPGAYRLDSGSGTDDPPHGPADLARAVRHLFAFGAASPVIPQTWVSAEAVTITAAAYPGSAVAVWRIPHDPAFEKLRITVDYIADVAVVGAFQFKATELGVSVELDSVLSAANQRRVTVDWTPAGMDRTYGGSFHTIEFYAKGNGAAGCKVLSIWVERIPLASPIDSGTWYSDQFIPPDSVAYQADAPLSSDTAIDLIASLAVLANVRLKCILNWSAVAGSPPADSMLSILAPLLPSDVGINILPFGWTKIGGGSVDFYGGREGLESNANFVDSVSGSGWKEFALGIQVNQPLIRDRQSMQQVIIDPSEFAYLESVSAFGF